MKEIDKWVYEHSKKPSRYAEVENPPKTDDEMRANVQDARQMQFNRWSKALQVYSGSYLPYNPKYLLKNGWIPHNEGKSKKPYNTEYERKSSGQVVLHHKKHINDKGKLELTHYHWLNPDIPKNWSKKKKNESKYLDVFGKICSRGSTISHIKPHRTRRKKK